MNLCQTHEKPSDLTSPPVSPQLLFFPGNLAVLFSATFVKNLLPYHHFTTARTGITASSFYCARRARRVGTAICTHASETHALKQETGPNDGSRRPITAMQGEDFCNPVIFHLCIFAEVSGCLCSTPSPFHPVFCLCRGCQLLDFLFRRFFCLLNTLRIVRIIFKFPNMCIRVVP